MRNSNFSQLSRELNEWKKTSRNEKNKYPWIIKLSRCHIIYRRLYFIQNIFNALTSLHSFTVSRESSSVVVLSWISDDIFLPSSWMFPSKKVEAPRSRSHLTEIVSHFWWHPCVWIMRRFHEKWMLCWLRAYKAEGGKDARRRKTHSGRILELKKRVFMQIPQSTQKTLCRA